MTRAVLVDFGGELPAIPVDALPAANAQEARNLFAGSQDFRPLREDVAVAACPLNTRTLYRMQRRAQGGFHGLDDAGEGWLLTTVEVDYVRGQVDDDATERTYFTSPDWFTPGAFDLSSVGSPRQLGVPAPAELVATAAQERKPFLRDDAEKALTGIARQVRDAVIDCTVDPRTGPFAQRAARYSDYAPSGGVAGTATLTPRNGPKSNYKMGPTEEIAGYLPERYRDQYATLWAVRSLSDLTALFGATVIPQIGVVIGSGSIVAVPLVCLPPSWIPDVGDPLAPGEAMFIRRMRAVQNPKDDTALFDGGELENLAQVFIAGSRMANRVPELVRQLDDVTREFSQLILNTPLPTGQATPRPVEPVKPGVPQYTYGTPTFGGGGTGEEGGP